ncbi:MAG: transferase, partial [Gemmataceae bacterium]
HYRCGKEPSRRHWPGSVSTFTTFSLTHELESYQGRPELERFIALLHQQLALGGRWLNVDVVGPEDPDTPVLLWLNSADGRSDDYDAEFADEERVRFKQYLSGLSTLGRFQRFARDFRRAEGYHLRHEWKTIDGETHVSLRLADACEFLSKKDYLDNWNSEMHETFCYWSFSDWKSAVERAGFVVQSASHAFTNPWIVTNRLEGKARLYQMVGTIPQPMPWPVTNMLLVAEKR